jgi:hypothetical protein
MEGVFEFSTAIDSGVSERGRQKRIGRVHEHAALQVQGQDSDAPDLRDLQRESRE